MGGSSPTHPPATFCASRSSPPARGRGQPVLWDTCALQTPNATPKKHKPKSRWVSEEPQGSLGLSVLHPSPGAPGTLAMPGPGPAQRGAPRHGGAASSGVLGCCQQRGHHPTTWQQGAAAPQTRRGPARAGRQRPNPPGLPFRGAPAPFPGLQPPPRPRFPSEQPRDEPYRLLRSLHRRAGLPRAAGPGGGGGGGAGAVPAARATPSGSATAGPGLAAGKGGKGVAPR